MDGRQGELPNFLLRGVSSLAYQFPFIIHIVLFVKGIPNGVAHEKKGNKRPLAEERSVS